MSQRAEVQAKLGWTGSKEYLAHLHRGSNVSHCNSSNVILPGKYDGTEVQPQMDEKRFWLGIAFQTLGTVVE